jgi:acetyl esterase/lipase
MTTDIHPDLVGIRRVPNFPYGPVTVKLMRALKPKPMQPDADLSITELTVPGPTGAPDVSLRIFRSRGLTNRVPALFWIHGGGMIVGSPEQDDRRSAAFAKELGIAVAAVRYRLAPEHPAPAPIEDAYAGLLGLVAHAGELGIDPTRIAIGGGSAGGGIAAGLALLAHDRGEVTPVFQLLVYPMLDDRTTLRPKVAGPKVHVWTRSSNRYGWKSYLGSALGGPDVSPYAAPARRDDLHGLPPAWIGVGTLDLFHDEDVEYARRLNAAGVPCELVTVPGAFHGFDAIFPDAPVSRDFFRPQVAALAAALGTPLG